MVSLSETLITVEATGIYHEAIVHFLYEEGFQVFVANPGRAKKFAQSLGLLHKTDKSDAAMLAKYGSLQADNVQLWKPESPQAREIKVLVRRLNALVKDVQRESNRLEASSISDVFNEKLNKTCIITDLQNIEILETEEQKQYTFNAFLNYRTQDKENYPTIKNIQVNIVAIRRRLLKDDIFAPNRYDTTKFVIKEMRLIDSVKTPHVVETVNKYEQDYYSFKKLMTEPGDFTNDDDIDNEMIRNRKKHEHEMDFRNIIIEDDNYLNDYMVPEKVCRP